MQPQHAALLLWAMRKGALTPPRKYVENILQQVCGVWGRREAGPVLFVKRGEGVEGGLDAAPGWGLTPPRQYVESMLQQVRRGEAGKVRCMIERDEGERGGLGKAYSMQPCCSGPCTIGA